MSQFLPPSIRISSGQSKGLKQTYRSLSMRLMSLSKTAGEKFVGFTQTKAQKSIQLRRQELIDFYQRFEQFVEVLCDAAHLGPSENLDRKFNDLQEYLRPHYQPLQGYLSAYVRPLPSDAENCMQGSGRFGDVFDALFAFDALSNFLEADDGYMISRISRAREALMRYGEHLRKLDP